MNNDNGLDDSIGGIVVSLGYDQYKVHVNENQDIFYKYKQGRKMSQNKVLCTSLGKPFYNSEVYLTI